MLGNIQRDLVKWIHLNVKDADLTLRILARHHGRVLNTSKLGRLMGISYHTVNRRIEALVNADLLRLLFPMRVKPGRRLLKSPKIYVRNTAILLQLLGIQSAIELQESTLREQIFKGFMIEQIVSREQAKNSGSLFCYYGGFGGPHICLIIDRLRSRTGIIFKFKNMLEPGDWTCLKSALKEELVKRGFIVYPGNRAFFAARDLIAVPALGFLDQYNLLTNDKLSIQDIREILRPYNSDKHNVVYI
ncbi:MAG TPA: DUF4143 domain-containing protein [Spirochaetales bacterium]|nr:DUF4143 domain-containing protein [Spirochaetales bacterium]